MNYPHLGHRFRMSLSRSCPWCPCPARGGRLWAADRCVDISANIRPYRSNGQIGFVQPSPVLLPRHESPRSTFWPDGNMTRRRRRCQRKGREKLDIFSRPDFLVSAEPTRWSSMIAKKRSLFSFTSCCYGLGSNSQLRRRALDALSIDESTHWIRQYSHLYLASHTLVDTNIASPFIVFLSVTPPTTHHL